MQRESRTFHDSPSVPCMPQRAHGHTTAPHSASVLDPSRTESTCPTEDGPDIPSPQMSERVRTNCTNKHSEGVCGQDAEVGIHPPSNGLCFIARFRHAKCDVVPPEIHRIGHRCQSPLIDLGGSRQSQMSHRSIGVFFPVAIAKGIGL